ncbi:hypothetical protein B0H15DRAFT_821790 [Mycena belliarum]|uniref:Uncharacterized protein n=1 Tax=Mycena belliarum TaxID=1033014 RepID=A0AAD6UFJ9_9AGAR|nr:hypothetical protein B0H15DRAFT_821790 [Mycena belliae]
MPLCPSVMAHKIAVGNFHQFQGIERPVVLVFNSDASYFKYFGRGDPQDRCPAPVLSALTRATEKLVIVHITGQPTMKFVRDDYISEFADFFGFAGFALPSKSGASKAAQPSIIPPNIDVSELARNIPKDKLDKLVRKHLDCCTVTPARPPLQHIVPRTKVTSDKVEDREEIVGTLLSAIITGAVEYVLVGTTESLEADATDFPEKTEAQIARLSRAAVEQETNRSGCKQLKIAMENHPHNWITEEQFVKARDHFLSQFEPTADIINFEVPISLWEIARSGQSVKLNGRLDAVEFKGDNERVFEVKFQVLLTLVDRVQAAVGGYGRARARGFLDDAEIPPTFLNNLSTGESIRIRATCKQVRELILDLLEAKYYPLTKSTEEFLQNAKSLREKANGNSAN